MRSKAKFMFVFMLSCIAALIIIYVGMCYYMNNGYLGLSYIDLNGHWVVRAHAIAPNKYEGKLITFPTVPWALIIGQIFYAGFLPLNQAQILNTLFHIAAYIFTMYLLYELLKKDFEFSKIFILFMLPAAHFSFMYSLWWGNEGGIICLLMIDALLILKKNPYIAGIIISACMCKPQITGIFCIMLLFMGKDGIKSIITAAIIDLAAWFAAANINNISMIQLLSDCFNSGADDIGFNYLGLLHFLRFVGENGVNKNIVLALNMSIAIIFMLVLYKYLKTNLRSEKLMTFAAYIPACIASTMWMYKNGTDYLVLIYPAAFAVILCMYEKISRRDFNISLLCCTYLLLSRFLVYAGIVIYKTNLSRGIYKGIDSLIIMIVGVILCRLIVRNQEAFCSD